MLIVIKIQEKFVEWLKNHLCTLKIIIMSSVMREHVSEHLSSAKNIAMNVNGFQQVSPYNSEMALWGSYCRTSIETISSHKTIERQSKSRERETCEFPPAILCLCPSDGCTSSQIALESEIIRMLYFFISDRCSEELLPLLSQATAQEVYHCERTAS